jgi:hypothetical protein
MSRKLFQVGETVLIPHRSTTANGGGMAGVLFERYG